MKALIVTLLGAATLAGLGLLFFGGESPVRVVSAQVERADIEDALVTNGRIEAAGRSDLYAETSGRVLRVEKSVGDMVQPGAVIATLDSQTAGAELAQAQARVEAARAELAVWDSGLPVQQRLDIEAQIATAQAQRRALQADLERAQRLIDKEAAPKMEAVDLERRIADLDREIADLNRKLEQKPDAEGRAQIEARIREAEAGVALARRRAGASQIRSTVAGSIYALSVRPGDYVAPGALVARIAGGPGVQARLFIDEPELGRVELGSRATLTADAYPGKSWTCAVDRLPSEIVELETRRVGEVLCSVEGDPGRLIPNLTVSARIPSAHAAAAPSLPREAVQHDGEGDFVWAIDAENRLRRAKVETGVRGDARIEIRSGLELGARVALPGAEPVHEGELVEETGQ
ncbi:MAG: efflux RND transporter periplasmic adaptor subunit [Acidobacteria bacterium]|nr:efflux RND transporter periplasmic adaptor subunit [Acidobacteriota bacterium]